jgi:hypothetical protein
MDPEASSELRELINAMCDGLANRDVVQRLEEQLGNDPDAVRGFVEYLDMHAALRWLVAPVSMPDDQLVHPSASVDRPKSLPWRLARSINQHGLAVLAASLLLCVLTFLLGNLGSSIGFLAEGGARLDPGASGIDSNDIGVARITGLVDCKWKTSHEKLDFGQAIPSGQSIELTQGLLQFTFDSGAKVIMQGPARFTPQSGMDAQLAHGKVSAVVPERARGYTVTTPTAEIVDLGTEFAVDVDENGTTEVHVLDGDVVARGRLPDGKLRGEAVHARKSDALRFVSHVEDIGRMAAQPEKFARHITPKLTEEELPPLPVVHDLELWVAADLLVNRDDTGRVSAWRDICIGDNQAANDACQFLRDNQPMWVADSGLGQPSIRFNGDSTRLFTDAISTGNRVSMFVVCAPSANGQNATRWGGQLLNFGGQAPTIELAVHHDQRVYSGLWAANAVGIEVVTGEVLSKRTIAGPRYVLSYTYDMDLERAELWVNGESQGTATASLSPQISGPRTIGGHGYHDYVEAFYRGDIYEVLIYDTAIDDSERSLLTDYLCERYHIEQ